MGFGITELVVVLAIVLLLFGTKKLKTLGSDLGSAIKGFRTAVVDEDAAKADPPAKLEADDSNGTTIEGSTADATEVEQKS